METELDSINEEYSAREWEDAEKDPRLLFKFKSIEKTIDLIRILDGIKNGYIFFPSVDLLNDSLEGQGTFRYREGGKSSHESSEVKDYRVLSFTENCFSPVMWSSYGGDRAGVCLGYFKGNHLCIDNDSPLKDAERVSYDIERKIWCSDEDSAIRSDLLHKRTDWSYEKEWRLIRYKGEERLIIEDRFLACIIVGEKTDEYVKEILSFYAPTKPIYTTHCDEINYCLNVSRNDISFKNVDELYEDIIKYKKRFKTE